MLNNKTKRDAITLIIVSVVAYIYILFAGS